MAEVRRAWPRQHVDAAQPVAAPPPPGVPDKPGAGVGNAACVPAVTATARGSLRGAAASEQGARPRGADLAHCPGCPPAPVALCQHGRPAAPPLQGTGACEHSRSDLLRLQGSRRQRRICSGPRGRRGGAWGDTQSPFRSTVSSQPQSGREPPTRRGCALTAPPRGAGCACPGAGFVPSSHSAWDLAGAQ